MEDALVFSLNNWGTIYGAEDIKGQKDLEGKNQEFCFKCVILRSPSSYLTGMKKFELLLDSICKCDGDNPWKEYRQKRID